MSVVRLTPLKALVLHRAQLQVDRRELRSCFAVRAPTIRLVTAGRLSRQVNAT